MITIAESSGDVNKYADENAKTIIEDIIKTNNAYKDYSVIYQYLGD